MPAETRERLLPANLEAERSILGAILLDAFAFTEADCLKLLPEHFSLDSHRRIYARMRKLNVLGQPIDLVALCEQLDRGKELEAVGGRAYVSSLTDGVPRRPSIENHIRLVREKALQRQIIYLTDTIREAAWEEADSPAELLDVMEPKVSQLRETGVADPWHRLTAEDCMRKALRAWDEVRLAGGNAVGLTTGLLPLDVLTTGIRKHEYWVIGARPRMGKTSLLMQIALANARQGRRVAMFSMEMNDIQLMLRCMEHAGIAKPWQVRDCRLLEEAAYQAARASAMQRIGTLPLWVRAGRRSIADACAEARLAIRKYGVELVLLDYLQLADAPGKLDYEKVSAASTAIDKVIDKTGVPWVVSAQLNREADDPQRWPRLSDLRGSGQIEQDADVVILIHREANQHGEPTETGQLILAKQREGPGGHEPVIFDDHTKQFAARGR
ncbi:MAG: hypothetical protein JO041_10805 [Acidobacteria bacterium]|nr:hypothetical protein [Acidobacteriota bacterium]